MTKAEAQQVLADNIAHLDAISETLNQALVAMFASLSTVVIAHGEYTTTVKDVVHSLNDVINAEDTPNE